MKPYLCAMSNATRYTLAAILSGLLLWMGWPPHASFLAPLLFVALVPLLWIEEQLSRHAAQRSRAKVLGYSYLGFLVFNALTTWWVCNASLVGGLFAIIANAFLMAVVFLLFHITKQQLGKALGYFGLIVYWLGFEYLHLRWELTWPWLTLGNGLAEAPMLIQWYEWVGALGGSLWLLGANLLIYRALHLWWDLRQQSKANPQDKDLPLYRRVRHRLSLLKLAGLIGIPIAISLILWYTYDDSDQSTAEVVVVQPNIDPYTQKFRGAPDFIPYAQQVDRMLRLSDSLRTDSTAVVAWPETSMPGGLDVRDIWRFPQVQQVVEWIQQYPSLAMMIGIEGYVRYGDYRATATARYYEDANEYYDAFNTAIYLTADTGQFDYYHKSKLVPGVERMPYPEVFRFLEGLAINMGGITGSLGTQHDREVFYTHDSLGLAPIICYESVFGDFVTDYVAKGADLLFIITNDGWWGNTAGYKQHLAYARLRAIETRRSIARSANTGISGFINQRGEIRQTTDWWVPTATRSSLRVNTTITAYVQYGDAIGRTAGLIAILLLLYTFVSGRTNAFFYRRNKMG